MVRTERRIDIKEEGKLTGIKEIARRANVSIGTVDRVLHNREGVSKTTKEKILKIIEEMNYQPNILARRLASRKEINIALLIPEVGSENPYWEKHEQAASMAEAEMAQFGIKFHRFKFQQGDASSFKAQARLILDNDFHGVLMVPLFLEESKELLDELQIRKVPTVFVDTNIPGVDNVSFVGQDSFQSGQLAARLFSKFMKPQGTLLIVNIARDTDNHVNYSTREGGFRWLLKKDERYKNVNIVRLNASSGDDIELHLEKALKQYDDVQGIFVTNTRGYIVGQYLFDRDIKGITVVGYDLVDANLAHLESGKIDFLISQKPKKQIRKGLDILYKALVEGDHKPAQYHMPIDIIMKENVEYYQNSDD